MKKLFTSLLLLVLLLVGTETRAAYSLTVAGYTVNTNATSVQTITGSNITGTITYNPSNRTLTMNNATIDCNSYPIFARGYTNGNDLNICFYGNNTIKTSDSSSLTGAIYVGGNCRVYMYSGSMANGPATVTIKNTGNGSAIRVPEAGGRIDIVRLRLYAEASNYHCVQGSAGAPGDYIFASNDSYIELKAPTDRNALYNFTGWYTYVNNLPQAFFSDSSHSWSSSQGGIVDASGNLVNSTIIVPPLSLGGMPFSSAYDWSVTTSSEMASYIGLTAGTISYSYSTKTLTMNGVTMNSGPRDLMDSFVSGLTVNLTGANTLTTSSICMDLYGGTTLSGSGSLTATSNGTTVYMNSGWNCPLTINVDGAVRLSGRRTVYNSANSTNNPNNDLILKKAGNGSDYFFTSAEGYETISGVCHLTMEDMDIYTTGCYFDRSSRQIKKTGGEVVKGSTVNIYRVGEWYDLYVAGHRLSDVTQYGRFGSPYLKSGTVYYNPTKQELAISGATIEMPSGSSKEYCSIYSFIKDLTINATGTNNWTSEYVGLNLGGSGTTTIKGTGTLNITSTASTALNLFGTTSLTLARSSDAMAVQGKKYGFKGSTMLTIQKDGSSGALYEFAGETANITGIPTLTLGDGVRIATTYQWFNSEQQAVYYKNAIAHSSDPGNVNATWIRGDVTWTTYPVYVGGTQFYGWSASGNINGLWNKYVKGGNISYNPSTNTLNLSNAVVDKGDDSNVNCIYSNKDGLIINVTGTSELKSTGGGWSSMNLNDNTTIKGIGTLNVTGEKGGIFLYGNNKKLTLDDVNVNVDYDICGDNKKGNLEINIATEGKKVTIQGNVLNWESITFGDGTAILSPTGAYVQDGAIKNASGYYARNIVIGKLETYNGLTIAGTPVTNANCDDILGNGVFSYDNATKTLTISGNYESKEWIIESHIEDLTINVASESNLVGMRSGSSIIRLFESTTITGGGLRMENTEGYAIGIFISNGNLTLDHAQIYIVGDGFEYGITGAASYGTKLNIKNSDIEATTGGTGGGAIYDWDGITMEGCWIIEPLTAQIFSYGIADAKGNIVGYSSRGTVVITSDRDLYYDGISSVNAAQTTPVEIYDLSGRKLDQARSGVNIIRTKDGKVVKELHK